MDRVELGERLQQWHSSMSDPIYAVGSFYFAGQVYPKKEVVEDCISNLKKDIDQCKRMLKGEKVRVWNSHYGRWTEDLKAFAGYTNRQLKKNIKDLEEILSEVERFLTEDYNGSE